MATKKSAAPAADKTKAKKTTKTSKPAKTAEAKADAKPSGNGPLARLKALGSKEAVVKNIVDAVARVDEDTDALKARLLKASNQQLLRLVKVTDQVKKKYGSRDKMIQAVGAAWGKAKDNDFIAKLQTLSLPKLWDLASTAERHNKNA